MATAQWLQLLATIVGLAVIWGGVQARLKHVEKTAEKLANDLAASRSDQGARIGDLVDRVSHLEGANGQPRPAPRTRTRKNVLPDGAG